MFQNLLFAVPLQEIKLNVELLEEIMDKMSVGERILPHQEVVQRKNVVNPLILMMMMNVSYFYKPALKMEVVVYLKLTYVQHIMVQLMNVLNLQGMEFSVIRKMSAPTEPVAMTK